MNDAALAELVRAAVRAEVEPLRMLVESLRPPADDTAEKFCAAVIGTYGSTPFFACDMCDFVQAQPGLRGALREAMQRLCKADRTPTPQQLGMALRGLLARPPAGFVVEATDRRGTTQWLIVDMRDRVPPSPQ